MLKKIICFILIFYIILIQLIESSEAIELTSFSSNDKLYNIEFIKTSYLGKIHQDKKKLKIERTKNNRVNKRKKEKVTDKNLTHKKNINMKPHYETFYPRELPDGLKSFDFICIEPDISSKSIYGGGKVETPKFFEALRFSLQGKGGKNSHIYKGGECRYSIDMDTKYQRMKIGVNVLKNVSQLTAYGIGASVANELIKAYTEVKKESIKEGKTLDPCKPIALHIDGDKTFYEVSDSKNCSVVSK